MPDTTPQQLLLKLIDIPSVTGDEAAIGTFLADYLTDQGFAVTKIPVTDQRFNVLAQVGRPRVLLQAHMDVVPPHIPAREDEECIYGRGACDTKGSIASMIAAAQSARAAGATNFGLLFTVGEEVNFAGAKKAQATVAELGAFLVVGEPSQLQPVNAHYGILVLKIVCKGQTAHSSEPQLGENAIDTLVQVLSGPIAQLELSTGTLMSLVKIEGGLADNVIPDRAEALFTFRIAPGDTIDYPQRVQELIGQQGAVEIVQQLPPVSSKIPEELSFLGTGQQVKYCTELNFFKTGVVLGPGDISDAHTPHEKVSKDALTQAAQLYQRILQAYQQ